MEAVKINYVGLSPLIGAGNDDNQNIPILYGGNIKDNINRIIHPIFNILDKLKKDGINLNPKKISQIYSHLGVIQTFANDLNDAEHQVNVFTQLINRYPNNRVISDYDLETELTKLKENKTKIETKLGTKIANVEKLHQNLLRFVN